MARTGARARRPVPAHVRQFSRLLTGYCSLHFRRRFFERYVHLDVQIGAALLRRRAPALGQHFRKQVAEARGVIRAAGRKIEALELRRLPSRRRRRRAPD